MCLPSAGKKEILADCGQADGNETSQSFTEILLNPLEFSKKPLDLSLFILTRSKRLDIKSQKRIRTEEGNDGNIINGYKWSNNGSWKRI